MSLIIQLALWYINWNDGSGGLWDVPSLRIFKDLRKLERTLKHGFPSFSSIHSSNCVLLESWLFHSTNYKLPKKALPSPCPLPTIQYMLCCFDVDLTRPSNHFQNWLSHSEKNFRPQTTTIVFISHNIVLKVSGHDTQVWSTKLALNRCWWAI